LQDGFVEQDANTIFENVLQSVQNCIQQFKQNGFDENTIVSIGISNQRETFVVWDKDGKPLYNAIVWQCKRSIQICEQLKENKLTDLINQKTGLFIDPYFSATKLMWLVKNNEAVSEAIKNGNAFFGTIDTWLLYKLTNGTAYATDYTNASRTMLFNLHTLNWDNELIEGFELSGINLPQIKSSSANFGNTTCNGLLANTIPISALIGDSHAAAFGEGCFEKGTTKATLGTGCSLLMNIGNKPVTSKTGMITTICWSVEDRIDYALEGVIVSCGATIEWLKNELNLFTDSTETATMAKAEKDNGGVYLIPAFSGLGSPHWQMERKASLTGMTFGTTKNHLVRAALESIPYQIKDVIMAMEKDAEIELKEINVDGGITTNAFVIQFLANLLQKNVAAIGNPDVSALGAAYLAGLQIGLFDNIEHLQKLNTQKKYTMPATNCTTEQIGYKGWQNEIAK
jgi:glycerol kinase